MSATFIPALVIKHNNTLFLTADLVVGKTMSIPTPGAGGKPDGDYWANPISDYGIVTGFDFKVKDTPSDTTPPDDMPQAFSVFRLVQLHGGNDVWWVLGSTVDAGSPVVSGYISASQDAECCDATPRTLPDSFDDILVGCQNMCEWDANGKYFAELVLPPKTSGTRYYPSGYLNDTPLTTASASGYNTVSALLTFLNASWGSVGTWTAVVDGQSPANTFAVKATQTAGSGDDVLCASIIAITP